MPTSSFSSTLRSTAAGTTGLLMLGTASAQTFAPFETDDAWRVKLTPYVWMTGLKGHIRPVEGGSTAQVNNSFSDILQNLDAAFFFTGTAYKGRLVVQGDFSYVSTSGSASLPRGLSAQAKVHQTLATLSGGYNWQLTPSSNIDLMAGVRLWDIRANIRVPGAASVQSNIHFVDPIVAARWRQNWAPQWSTLLYLDIGGFGVGSDSTRQVVGAVNYQWSENLFFSLGYRYLNVNLRNDGKRLDFKQSGPMLGATLTF